MTAGTTTETTDQPKPKRAPRTKKPAVSQVRVVGNHTPRIITLRAWVKRPQVEAKEQTYRVTAPHGRLNRADCIFEVFRSPHPRSSHPVWVKISNYSDTADKLWTAIMERENV